MLKLLISTGCEPETQKPVETVDFNRLDPVDSVDFNSFLYLMTLRWFSKTKLIHYVIGNTLFHSFMSP